VLTIITHFKLSAGPSCKSFPDFKMTRNRKLLVYRTYVFFYLKKVKIEAHLNCVTRKSYTVHEANQYQ